MSRVSSRLESRFRKAGRLAPILAAAFLLSPPALPAAPEEQKQPPPGSEPAAQAREDSISPPPDSFDYVIGVEDVIQISVWKNPDLSVTVPVRPDGKISLPLIDDMQAAGVTPLQLKEDLTRRWKSFLSAPEVSVIIKEVNSFKVFVVGQVAKPGQLLLRGPTRLLQALSLAGGFTNFADSSNIVILSDGGGHEVRREVNYHKVVSGKRPEDNVLLRRGDTVVVP